MKSHFILSQSHEKGHNTPIGGQEELNSETLSKMPEVTLPRTRGTGIGTPGQVLPPGSALSAVPFHQKVEARTKQILWVRCWGPSPDQSLRRKPSPIVHLGPNPVVVMPV